MEDEKDIQPPVNPQNNVQGADNALSIQNNERTSDLSHADAADASYAASEIFPIPTVSLSEAGADYSKHVLSMCGLTLEAHQEDDSPTPTFKAPFLSPEGLSSITHEQLVAGIFINVPRSPRLWVGDQLKMRWGYNTYYTTIAEPTCRTGPRLTQYLNSERLGAYPDGVVEVRYEVVRRSRLVGISETLEVTLTGNGQAWPKPPPRGRAIRRRKLKP